MAVSKHHAHPNQVDPAAESGAAGSVSLQQTWRALDGSPLLRDVAEIHRGIEYRVPFRKHIHELLSDYPRPGFAPGVVRVQDDLEPLYVSGHAYLNMDPSLMLHEADCLPWQRPKVLVNAARLGQGPWRLVGAADHDGLAAYRTFHTIWPTADISPEVLAAVLCGPVANVFVQLRSGPRDNRIPILDAIPVPRLSTWQAEKIFRLVNEYQIERRSQNQPEHDPKRHGALLDLMLRIDAEVLTAYDLPPRVERELLDYFWGAARPGFPNFSGYYPPSFRPALPWRMHITGEVGHAAARATLDRVPVLHDPAASELLRDVIDLTQ